MLIDGLLIEHQCRPRAVAAAGTSATIIYQTRSSGSCWETPSNAYRSLSAKSETHLPGKHVRSFQEFRTPRHSKRDEPERLALPQSLVGMLNELMDRWT